MPAPIVKQQVRPPGLGLGNPVRQTVLVYNGIDLGDQVKLLEYDRQPVYDWSGVDHLYDHVVLGVRAIVNPFALATNDGVGVIVGGAGNLAGETLANLETFLMTNQRQLIFQIGTEQVLVSPQNATFLCDANNGPHPLAFRILEVKGTKTVVVYFRIETWVAAQRFDKFGAVVDVKKQNMVLSNRWSVESHVDEDWKTTIVTRGRMKLRADLLNFFFGVPLLTAPATPDIFRGAVLPLPVPDGFKRDDVTIIAREDATELDWTCTDNQKTLNLGNKRLLTRIKGQYTTGSEIDVKDAKGLIGATFAPNWAGAGAGAVAGFLAGGPIGFIVGAAVGFVWNMVPTVKNAFQFRAYGQPGADRAAMLLALTNLALDRFSPQGNPFNNFGKAGGKGPVPVSLYATLSADTDDLWVELRGEFFGVPQQLQGVGWNPVNFAKVVNMSNDVAAILAGAPAWLGQTPAPNPNPPNDGKSRGDYVGTLLEQALKGDFVVPANNAPSAGPAIGADFGARPFQ